MSAWEENVEETTSQLLKKDTALIAETSFTQGSNRGTSRKLPPLLRQRGSGEESADEISQRLGPPLSEDQVGGGSRRQSVAGSMSSQADTRSYRERLRDHIQTVKEQAGSSVVSTNARLKHSLKLKSCIIVDFQDVLGKEESEVEAALERHEQMRKKWKHLVNANTETETAHDFFTKEWEDEQLEEDLPSSPKVFSEECGEGDQVKLVTKEYLGLPEEWRAVHCFMEPTMDNFSVRIHKENEVYYYPDHQPVKLEDKLGPDGIPRYIEDEGLFVSPKPVGSIKSYNKLQQRLVTESRRHWFGEDGELKTNLLETTERDKPDLLMSTVYVYPDMMSVEEPAVRSEPSPRETYLLDLEVRSISWWHHPLSSREHVAARLVLTRYQEYSGRVCAGLGQRLANKLQALRTARDNVRRTGDTERYNRYSTQVLETRELRMSEGRKDRAAVVNCLNAWLELRRLRAQQGYIITPVRLNIIELDGTGENNPFGSKNEWETELKHQVAEYLEEEEEKLKNLDDQVKEREGCEPRRVLKRRSPSEVVEDVREKLSDCLVLPGEPVIALELGDEPVTPETDISNLKELERRAAHRQCQLVVRVLCNRQVVCRSRLLSLYPHFTTCLNQLFCLQISDWPQSLTLELLVEGGLGPGKRISASVFVPVPNRSTTLAGASVEGLEFNSPDKLGPYQHEGVGCGLEDSGFAGGVITCRVGWSGTGGPLHNAPSTRSTPNILTSMGNMRDWVSRAQLDPNDPSNAEIFQYIKAESVKSKSQDEQEEGLPNGEFCTMEEIEENPRLKLLSLRSQVVPEFRDIRNIPLREREIPQDIFQLYEKRIQCPVRNAQGVGETALEWQREWSCQQLNVIRDNILQHCRQMQQQHSLREVIMEDQVPDIGTLGLTFMKWLQPKRPLRPTRKERKKLPVVGLVGQEVEVIVNVVRAFQVPVRMDVDPLLDNGLSLVPVRPFVEVSFQNRKSRTTTAEGANPTWNQDLRIPVKLPSSGFYNVQDKLYCQLYDETVVDLLEDDRQRETDIHQRLQRQWLGSLQIPFSSLCSNARIEGTFHLYSPPVLLGYQRESQQRQSLTELRDSTFLTLFITVHPPLHPPEPFKEQLTCSEILYMEQHLQEWKAQVYSQVPHRPVKCLVVDTSAKSVCVTRFFRPLTPPVLEEGEASTPEMALRFVSKIPMVPGNMLFPGLFDVWLTAQQVLTLLSGDMEDHAVLLCCYLLSLGLRAWLLLGSGVPHGPTALVFTRDPDTFWDPGSGQRFNPQDSFCPLHRVFCLINQDNIWANVQREEAVSRTRFDVSRRADWWPAFNRSAAAPQDSVQTTTLQYTISATIATDTALLQDKLEKTLRDSITKWRPTTRTVWNRYVTVKLRKLLPGLERAAWRTNMSVSAEHINQLSQTLSSYKVCGFTQNFTFTSTEEILEAVKATGLHTNESSDVEFALAVYVHPFVCGVLSVWVYITSLSLRR